MRVKAYKKKFKQVLEVDNNKKLLSILYENEKNTYQQMSEIMLKVAKMGGEMNMLMGIVEKNIKGSKEKLAENLDKILQW